MPQGVVIPTVLATLRMLCSLGDFTTIEAARKGLKDARLQGHDKHTAAQKAAATARRAAVRAARIRQAREARKARRQQQPLEELEEGEIYMGRQQQPTNINLGVQKQPTKKQTHKGAVGKGKGLNVKQQQENVAQAAAGGWDDAAASHWLVESAYKTSTTPWQLPNAVLPQRLDCTTDDLSRHPSLGSTCCSLNLDACAQDTSFLRNSVAPIILAHVVQPAA